MRAAVDEVGTASTCMRANIKVEMRAGKAGQGKASQAIVAAYGRTHSGLRRRRYARGGPGYVSDEEHRCIDMANDFLTHRSAESSLLSALKTYSSWLSATTLMLDCLRKTG